MQERTHKASQEDMERGFVKGIEDALELVEVFGPYCSTPDELASVLRLATENQGQLRLLMEIATRPARK